MRTNRLRGTVAVAAVAIGGLTLLPASAAEASAPLKSAVSDGASVARSGATSSTKHGPGRNEIAYAKSICWFVPWC